MGAYDDVLFAGEETGAAEPVSPEFNPKEYQEQKQQERDRVYDMIDKTTLELVDPNKLKEYLDIQARFNLYRPGNVLLIQAQLPKATRLKSYDDWKAAKAGVRKKERSLYILKSGKQFTRDDGTIGQYTDIKKVFDISQTYSDQKVRPPVYPEGRALLKALMNKSPVPAKADENLPDNMGAFYNSEANVIHVRPGMNAPDIFRCLSVELAHAELARNMGSEYSRENAQFSAYCASYVLCREYGVDVSVFTFENAPGQFEGKDPKEIRAELGSIREAAGEIGSRMREALQRDRAPKEQEVR